MGLRGGLIGRALGGAGGAAALGQAARDVAEVFTPNATRAMELSAEARIAALEQLGAEYVQVSPGWFDRAVNGLNRLPRPLLAFGTLGLFVYAMVDPHSFATRMVGLNLVPEPLWWLLGAIVGFYFGAREAFHFRQRPPPVAAMPSSSLKAGDDGNAALRDWRQGRDG
ncbi:methionine synthase I [Aliigemmobacter aestuarii]|uniref:Methionine synthase I n=1 Tax=Aliigemmobacter aestuarii TaxID=1445661 RepID=A0A4S3MN55_9RHOB|nr:holin family protein [Gemmobacter aestuarii]THD83151.1 methionine synthase I [Gemmobacter aestuarii]